MTDNKILTVTLNPSLDKTLITNHLNIGYYNHVADQTHLDASGRGVNVSRALDSLDVPTHAVVLLGDDAIGRAYSGLLAEEAFPTRIVKRAGPTRSDTIIVDKGEETETHIIDEGADCTEDDVKNILTAIAEIAGPGDTVIYAGILPRDAATDVYARLSAAAHEAGAQVVVMTSGDALSQSLKSKPEIVVLTQLEAESLFNYPIRTIPDMISAGNKLLDQGAGEVIVVANDYSGAVLVKDGDSLLVEIEPLETTGTDSGVVDAMLAGYLAGLALEQPIQDAFALGATALAHASTQIGNVFGSHEDVKEHRNRVSVQSANLDDKEILVPEGD